MSQPDPALRSLEYSSLRSEVIQSRQYVFERPLLIITAAGVAAVPLMNTPGILLLPAMFVFILLVNLWFTVNRLQSISRIAAYIDVVLESDKLELWKGWERSLRQYRIWVNSHSIQQRQQDIQPYIDQKAIPHALMFYLPTYQLHVTLVVILLIVSMLSLFSSFDSLSVLAFVATLATSAVFAWYAADKFRPAKLKGQIEQQRAIWLAVLEQQHKVQ